MTERQGTGERTPSWISRPDQEVVMFMEPPAEPGFSLKINEGLLRILREVLLKKDHEQPC